VQRRNYKRFKATRIVVVLFFNVLKCHTSSQRGKNLFTNKIHQSFCVLAFGIQRRPNERGKTNRLLSQAKKLVFTNTQHVHNKSWALNNKARRGTITPHNYSSQVAFRIRHSITKVSRWSMYKTMLESLKSGEIMIHWERNYC
jgi:hypothetical protein